MQIQLIVTLVIALILVVLTIKNPNPVPVPFTSWFSPQGIPLVVVILVSVLVGVIASFLLGLKKQLQLKDKICELQRVTDELRHPPVTADEEKVEEVEKVEEAEKAEHGHPQPGKPEPATRGKAAQGGKCD